MLTSQPIRSRLGRSIDSVGGEHFTGGVVRTTLAAWRHGEMQCPGCGLPVSADRDAVEELRTVTSSEPVGARVTHRRCGARFEVEFSRGPASRS